MANKATVFQGTAIQSATGADIFRHQDGSATITNKPLDTETTRAVNDDLIRETINDLVTKMRPSSTPFDTIMRSAKSKKAGSQIFQWYSVDTQPVKSTLTEITGGGNSPVLAQNFILYQVTVANINLFAVSDTIRIAGTEDESVDGNDLVLYVQEKSNGKLTCSVINGIDISGNIGIDGTKLTDLASKDIYRLARAAAEGDVQTSSFSALPAKTENFCQIFKFMISETTIQKNSDKEVKWDLNEVEEQGLYEFRMAIEASALFGVKGKIWDSVKNQPVYTTGGIVSSIKNLITMGDGNQTALTTNDLVDLTKEVFQGNSGSRKRICFMGSEFNLALSKIESVQKQLEAGNTFVNWGIEFNEIKTNFGTLECMQHDLLDLYGFADKAIILDPDFIDKWEFMPLKAETLDTRTPGIFDGDVKVWTEIAGYALRYPSCHAIVALKLA